MGNRSGGKARLLGERGLAQLTQFTGGLQMRWERIGVLRHVDIDILFLTGFIVNYIILDMIGLSDSDSPDS